MKTLRATEAETNIKNILRELLDDAHGALRAIDASSNDALVMAVRKLVDNIEKQNENIKP